MSRALAREADAAQIRSAVSAIAIGGSAGSLPVLKPMLLALPAAAPPVLLVLHLPDGRESTLHETLARQGKLAVKQAEDKEWIMPGTVYLAPPGYHLHVEREQSVALSRDETVHFSRPSIDVLFESAAHVYGEGLVAVILSGANRDGAEGLAAVLRAGGRALAQRPDTALVPTMPAAGIEAAGTCIVLSPQELAQWFAQIPACATGPGASRAG